LSTRFINGFLVYNIYYVFAQTRYYSSAVGFVMQVFLLDTIKAAVVTVVELRKFEIRKRTQRGDFVVRRIQKKDLAAHVSQMPKTKAKATAPIPYDTPKIPITKESIKRDARAAQAEIRREQQRQANAAATAAIAKGPSEKYQLPVIEGGGTPRSQSGMRTPPGGTPRGGMPAPPPFMGGGMSGGEYDAGTPRSQSGSYRSLRSVNRAGGNVPFGKPSPRGPGGSIPFQGKASPRGGFPGGMTPPPGMPGNMTPQSKIFFLLLGGFQTRDFKR
jgi:hypothetical protein